MYLIYLVKTDIKKRSIIIIVLGLAQLEVATDCKSVGHRFEPDNPDSPTLPSSALLV